MIIECVDPVTRETPEWGQEKPYNWWKDEYFGLAHDIFNTSILDKLFQEEYNPEIQKYLEDIDLEFILNPGEVDFVGLSLEEIKGHLTDKSLAPRMQPKAYPPEKIINSINRLAEILKEKEKELPPYYWLEVDGKRRDGNHLEIFWDNSLAGLTGEIGKVILSVYQRDLDNKPLGPPDYRIDVTQQKEMNVTLVDASYADEKGNTVWKRRIGKTVTVKVAIQPQIEHFKWLLDAILKIANYAKEKGLLVRTAISH